MMQPRMQMMMTEPMIMPTMTGHLDTISGLFSGSLRPALILIPDLLAVRLGHALVPVCKGRRRGLDVAGGVTGP